MAWRMTYAKKYSLNNVTRARAPDPRSPAHPAAQPLRAGDEAAAQRVLLGPGAGPLGEPRAPLPPLPLGRAVDARLAWILRTNARCTSRS